MEYIGNDKINRTLGQQYTDIQKLLDLIDECDIQEYMIQNSKSFKDLVIELAETNDSMKVKADKPVDDYKLIFSELLDEEIIYIQDGSLQRHLEQLKKYKVR